jgi:hypothetical protein
MDLYDCIYGLVLNIVKNLVSSCMDPLNECVLYGSFENPARLLMRMCAELYSFYQKLIQNTILYSNIFRSVQKNVKNFFN